MNSQSNKDICTKSKGKNMNEYRIDKTGYPLILIPPYQVYMHILPITKIQFEIYLCSPSNIADDHQYYLKMLNENPRTSPAKIAHDTFQGLFATAVRPLDAISFAKWLGWFDLPTVATWRACYLYLESNGSKNVLSNILSDENLNQFARLTLTWLLAQNNLTSMLDVTLLKGGFLEWVYTDTTKTSWGGLGKPSNVIANPLTEAPKPPMGNDFSQHIRHFGFRLIGKYDEN
jgi:hypothetical protein